MPNFIEWPGDQQGPPPYAFEGVDVWSFPTTGTFAELDGVVDGFLNAPRPGADVQYRPWKTLAGTGIVLVTVLWYERMRTIPWNHRGYLSQHELCFIIPVNRYEAGEWTGWALFTPYIFVDNPWSTVCGNTVVGYPKAQAGFSIGEDPYPISIEALAFRRYDPATPATTEPLVDIEDFLGSALTDEDMFWPVGPFVALFSQAGVYPLEPGTYDNVLSTLWSVRAPLIPSVSYDVVQLKQIRDSVDPTLAAYQSVLEYPVQLEKWYGGRVLRPAKVTLNPTDSWPIASKLGLNGTFTCRLAFWQKADYGMGKGTLV